MALMRQRDSVQARMASEITAIAASARQTLDTDTAQVEALRRQMYDLKAQAGAANEAEASIADMVHDVEIKRGQYADLYKRASELETERRVLMGNTRLVALAERSDKPFFPKTIPFLAAGLTLATLLAATAAIARDRVDGSLRTGVDLAQIAGVPVPRSTSSAQRNATSACRTDCGTSSPSSRSTKRVHGAPSCC